MYLFEACKLFTDEVFLPEYFLQRKINLDYMTGVLSTVVALVILAVASLIGGLLMRREGSEAWTKFVYFSLTCLIVALGLFMFFMSNFV